MDVEYLMQGLSEKVWVQVWKYISFPDYRRCNSCKKFNGKEYPYHSSHKPKLPIHSNCRCRYKLLKTPYDGKKVVTLTGFVGESRYIINEFVFDTDNNGRVIQHPANFAEFPGHAMPEIKLVPRLGDVPAMKEGI